MITSKEMQNGYVKLYKNLRNYIWPFSKIDDIANLEISIYDRFPDMNVIRNNLGKIRYNCTELVKDDEDLQKSLDTLEEIVNSDEIIYAKLDTRLEEGADK